MRTRFSACLLALVALMALALNAGAVPIPILDPGFDIFMANTLTPVTDNTFPNISSPGAGSGPVEDVSLLDFNTFMSKGLGDIPAGWTATGQRPAGSNNTGRLRCDDCFDSDSGVVASINNFGSDPYEDPNNPGMFITTPGRFTQVLTGVTVQANTLYTATIEVSDLDITLRGPFAPPTDNIVPGNPGRDQDDPATPMIDETINRIILSLFAIDASVTPATFVDLGGTLEFSDITPGGFFGDHDMNPSTPRMSISGGKSLLTLTVLTGAEVPAGDLTFTFTSGGSSELATGFAPSSQTFFDNAALDATPFAAEEDADFDGDGDVDGADFLIQQRNIGTGTMQSQGDADNSGGINAADVGIFREQFGETGHVGAVPEPATFAMGAIALAVGWAASRRTGSASRRHC